MHCGSWTIQNWMVKGSDWWRRRGAQQEVRAGTIGEEKGEEVRVEVGAQAIGEILLFWKSQESANQGLPKKRARVYQVSLQECLGDKGIILE